jgi:hypothetical protein
MKLPVAFSYDLIATVRQFQTRLGALSVAQLNLAFRPLTKHAVFV